MKSSVILTSHLVGFINLFLFALFYSAQSQSSPTRSPATVLAPCPAAYPTKSTPVNVLDCSYTGDTVSYNGRSLTPCTCGDKSVNYCLPNSGYSLPSSYPFYGVQAGTCRPYVCNGYWGDGQCSDAGYVGNGAACKCPSGQTCKPNLNSIGNYCDNPPYIAESSNTTDIGIIVGPAVGGFVLFMTLLCCCKYVALRNRMRNSASTNVIPLGAANFSTGNDYNGQTIVGGNIGGFQHVYNAESNGGTQELTYYPNSTGNTGISGGGYNQPMQQASPPGLGYGNSFAPGQGPTTAGIAQPHHDLAQEIQDLVALRDRGALSEDEFAAAKAKVIAAH